MSETATAVTETAVPPVDPFEGRAKEIGWRPKEQFQGDPEKWVDAKTFVERGEQFLPLVKAENRRLQEQLARAEAERQADRIALKAAQESIDGLKEFNREAAATELKAQRRQLRAELIAARREGDADKELQLQEQLDDLEDKVQQKPTVMETKPTTAEPAAPAADPTQRPEFQQFLRENSWFNEDPIMRAASLAIMQQAAQEGRLEGMTPAQRFSFAAAETRKKFRMESAPPTDSKVSGSTGPSGGTGGKSYSDLPSEARAACDRFEKRMVGEGRAFKTSAEWRKHYVQNYDWS